MFSSLLLSTPDLADGGGGIPRHEVLVVESVGFTRI
jgi:hypothetical protein